MTTSTSLGTCSSGFLDQACFNFVLYHIVLHILTKRTSELGEAEYFPSKNLMQRSYWCNKSQSLMARYQVLELWAFTGRNYRDIQTPCPSIGQWLSTEKRKIQTAKNLCTGRSYIYMCVYIYTRVHVHMYTWISYSLQVITLLLL